jgi:hypothetical protein
VQFEKLMQKRFAWRQLKMSKWYAYYLDFFYASVEHQVIKPW